MERKILKAVGDYCHRELQSVGIKGIQSEGGYYYMPDFEICRAGFAKKGIGGFHLHILVFPSSTSSILEMISSEGFQQHFSIISKTVCCGSYVKKAVAVTLISFAILKWDDGLSVELPFDLPVQIPVQLLLELKANLLDQNVNELEFELSRM